jgi:hypothetical protein
MEMLVLRNTYRAMEMLEFADTAKLNKHAQNYKIATCMFLCNCQFKNEKESLNQPRRK